MNIYEALIKQGSSATQLSELTDVELNNLEDGQSLIWYEASGKWGNGGAAFAGTPEALGIGYGTCTTATSTAAKVVALNDFVLTKNGIVSVYFANAVGASASLNVNSTGAKEIYFRGVAMTAGLIGAGDTAIFIYDGTHFNLIAIDKTYPIQLTSVLTAGSTSVTFTSNAITTTSVIDVYTNQAGLDYSSITASAGSVTLTYDAQSSDVTVMLTIRN